MKPAHCLLRAAALAALLASSAGCAAIGSMVDSATGGDEVRLLRQTGAPAEAEILRIWDTGITVNDDPVIGMEVEVTPAEGDPYQAVIPKTWISRLDIPQFQPGRILAVRYDPDNPTRVAVDNPPFPALREEPEPPESNAPDPGHQTSASASLRLCARSYGGAGEGFQTVFLVTGPENRRYELQRIAPADDEWLCVRFPDDFSDPSPAPPGRYRYEIRINGEIAERGSLTLDRH